MPEVLTMRGVTRDYSVGSGFTRKQTLRACGASIWVLNAVRPLVWWGNPAAGKVRSPRSCWV